MRIVVGGYIVGYPLGGMTWHHLNYLLGLAALGHDVTYLEDGAYLPPFDPTTDSPGDPTYGVDYLRRTLAAYDLRIPWHYRYGEFSAGLSVGAMRAHLHEADLFVAVGGVTPTEGHDLPRRSLVIDTDPGYTQLRMAGDAGLLDYYKRFARVATFGPLIGTPDCRLPTHGFDWIATRQPISLPHWPATPIDPTAAFTTVGKWDHGPGRTVTFEGRSYASAKSAAFERLLGLPRRTGAAVELRMDGMPADARDRFAAHRWRVGDAFEATRDGPTYQTSIRDALGELTAAKEIYSGLKSGWFSDRSAAFLASGRPVVTEPTGFEAWLPTGEGLFAFDDIEEAADAVRAVLDDPRRHATAARQIAERHFDARTVLGELLDAAS